MLGDLVGAVMRHQVEGLKRRTVGAIVEGAALGMVGLATVFLFFGLYLLLASAMKGWLAAILVALLAGIVATVLALVGRMMLRKQEEVDRHGPLAPLKSLGLMQGRQAEQRRADGAAMNKGPEDDSLALMSAALAAGVILGRVLKK